MCGVHECVRAISLYFKRLSITLGIASSYSSGHAMDVVQLLENLNGCCSCLLLHFACIHAYNCIYIWGSIVSYIAAMYSHIEAWPAAMHNPQNFQTCHVL